MEVVKVQIPINAPPGFRDCLIYDSRRERIQVMAVPARVIDAIAPAPKGYFEAWWSEAGWVIGNRVADEDW